jgi:hypothetical protein
MKERLLGRYADTPTRRYVSPGPFPLLSLLFLLPMACFSQRLTPLSNAPNWDQLNRFQETMTREAFVDLLDSVYAPNGAGAQWIKVEATRALIQENASDQFVLQFASSAESSKTVPRYWTTAANLAANNDLPLSGVNIAIDPGHLGGTWAKMEERWFQIGNSIPVAEGDMTLRVAQLLVPRLQSLGAKVTLVRSSPGPVTTVRPDELNTQAEASLRESGIKNILPSYTGQDDPNREDSIPWEAQKLFYRVDEIHTRAQIINEKIKPDLVLCLHFDAEPWGTSTHPELVSVNHLHLLINGAYPPANLVLMTSVLPCCGNFWIRPIPKSWPAPNTWLNRWPGSPASRPIVIPVPTRNPLAGPAMSGLAICWRTVFTNVRSSLSRPT